MTRIDDIEYTEKNETKFYKVVAEGKTYRAFATDKQGKPNKAFEKLKAGKIKKNSHANLKYTETTSGGYTYKNLNDIEQTATPATSQSSSSTNASKSTPQIRPTADEKAQLGISYTDKQVLIVRQNCCTHADNMATDIKDLTREIISEKAYYDIAESRENWIWRGIKK